MAKLTEKELRAFSNIGYVPPENRVAGFVSEDENVTNALQSLRYVNKRDKVAKYVKEILGEEEQAAGIDEYTATQLDEDGRYRKYLVRKDIDSGQIVDQILADDIEGISIEDVTAGKTANPLLRDYQEQELYKKIYADIDPTTDEFRSNIGKSWLQNTFDNTSFWSSIDKILPKLWGAEGGGVARQLVDDVVSKIQFKENNLLYGGQKVSIPPELAEDFDEWVGRKFSYESDGFLDQLSTTASSFMLDYPAFMLGGQVSGAFLKGIAPGLMRAAAMPARFGNIPLKAGQHIAQNLGMLSVVDTPRMIAHTLEGGTDALLEDIKHIGEFSILAGSFGAVGEYLGVGVSKLLQKPKGLQLNQVAQFLRRNPQVTQSLSAGLTSGMLGYTIGGETLEEKLATGLTFAGMHFASKNAWKSYIKGEKKAIMVENNADQLFAIRRNVERGMDLETATREAGASISDYYFREGNKLHKINKDLFITKGEVELIPESRFPTVELTPEMAREYRYITEIPPTARITMAEAFRQGKTEQLANEIRKDFPNNPYDAKTQKDLYEQYEYGKHVVSNLVGNEIYAQKLNSIFKKRQLPDEPTLNNMMVQLSKTWQIPYAEVKNKIVPEVVRYLENPDLLQRELFIAEGGETLPSLIVPKFDKDIAEAVKKTIEVITNSQQIKLIAETASPMRVAQRIPEKATIQPPTEGRVYYDMNGEIIPLDRYNPKENKAEIANIEFTPKKENILTGKQLREEQPKKRKGQQKESKINIGSEITYKLGEESIKAEITDIRSEGKEIIVRNEDGKQLVITSDMIKGVKSGKERVGQPEGQEVGRGGETTETSSSNRIVNVEGKEQPSGKVNEEAQKLANKPEIVPQIEKTQLEAPQETITEKPILTPTLPEKVAPRASKEEIFSKFRDDSLQKSAEQLTLTFEPNKADFRDSSGKVKPEIIQRLIDLESKAEKSAEKLSKETGENITKEDVLITALKPYYTAKEIGTMFALRNIYSEDAKRNGNFVNNRLKKLGLSFAKEGEQISKGEIVQAGLTEAPKPKRTKAEVEAERAEAEADVLEQSTITQNKITELLKQGKKESDVEVKELRQLQRELGKRYAELSADDKLFDIERPNVDLLRTNPGQRTDIEKGIREAIPNAIIEWDVSLPADKIGRTYVDNKGNIHIDFANLISARTPLHEKIHGQALLAADKVTVERILKEINPNYDGLYNSPEWVKAHEGLVERAMRSQKDSYGVVDRIRELWQKLQNFFTGKGWYSSAEFYRRLLNNELKLNEVAKEFDKPLYSTAEERYQKELDRLTRLRDDAIRRELTETERERFSDPHFPPANDAKTASRQFDKLAEWDIERKAFEYKDRFTPFSHKLMDNIFVAKAGGIFREVYHAAIQSGNVAYQKTKTGAWLNPEYKQMYDYGREMGYKTAEHFNILYKSPEAWNEAKHFRNISAEDAAKYTKKLEKYYEELSNGREVLRRNEGESLEAFSKRFGKEIGLTEKEIEADLQTQKAFKKIYESMRNVATEWHIETKDKDGLYNATASLNETEIKRFFGDNFTEGKSDVLVQREMKEAITNDPVLREKIAKHIASKLYPEYDTHYYNAVRPSDPKYYLVRGNKPSDNVYHSEVRWDDLRPGQRVHLDYQRAEYQVMKTSKEGVVLAEITKRGIPENPFILSQEEYNRRIDKWDNYLTYGEDKKQAETKAKEYFDKGYSVDEVYNIGELYSTGQYQKLTANQLQALIDAGHIPKNDQTIKALQDAIKAGRFEQHTIQKKYVKGMHFTPLEYEQQVERFISESVSASTRRIYLNKMQDYLHEWDAQIERRLTSPVISASEKERLTQMRIRGTKFYNKMAHSDASWVDGMRKMTTVYYLGVKPSFPFQQLFQNLQKGLPEAVAESPNGKKYWLEAYDSAMKLAYHLRGEAKNEKVETGLPQELIDLYKALDNRNLIAATGIKELMGDRATGETIGLGDAKYHYASGFWRNYAIAQKVAGLTGSVAEKFTRLHTLSLAYKLGKEKGLSGEALIDYASLKMDNIQDVWGAVGRPEWSQSKIMGAQEQKVLKALTKSLYTFKTFTLGNLGQLDRLARDRKWGALGTKLVVAMGLGGLRGLPFAATLFALADLLSGEDSEYEAYKLLDELNQENGLRFGDMINKGVFAQAGLDMSRLLGQGTSYATDVWSETRAQSVEGRVAEIMLGAPYGLTKDVLDGARGIQSFLKTQISMDGLSTDAERRRAYKNMSKITPIFLRNILGAMSLAKDGVEVRGNIIVKSDDLSWTDVVYKALSFSPLKVADSYEEYFSGTESKLSRAKGKISELKKIRKEISQSTEYPAGVKSKELVKVAEFIREAQKEEARLTKLLNSEKRKHLLTK